MSNLYEDFSETQRTVKNFAKKTIRDYMPYFLMVAEIIFIVSSKLYTGEIKDIFTADFAINLGTNILSVLFCYMVFVPYGYKREKLGSDEYMTIYTRWMTYSRLVRDGNNAVFSEYCHESVKKEREDKRRARIENKTMISWAEYEAKYRRMSRSALSELVKKGEIEKRDAKQIRKANGHIRVKECSPIYALCGVKNAHKNDAIRAGANRNVVSIASKPFIMIFFSVAFSLFGGKYVGLQDMEALYSMVYSIMLILIASVTGYAKGADNEHADLDRMRGRVLFLEEFFEAQGIALPKI